MQQKRVLSVVMGVLEPKTEPSGKAGNAFKCWGISPSQLHFEVIPPEFYWLSLPPSFVFYCLLSSHLFYFLGKRNYPHHMHVEVRGRLTGVGSLLPLWGLLGSNSGHRVQQLALYLWLNHPLTLQFCKCKEIWVNLNGINMFFVKGCRLGISMRL